MKNYDKMMLLSDMDGTLLDSGGQVSIINRMAIREFIAAGGRFGIATGRSHLNFEAFLTGVEVNAPCILYNGCALYDMEEKRFIELCTLPTEKLAPYLQFCLQDFPGLMVQVYCPEMCYIISDEELSEKEVVENHKPNLFCTMEEILTQPWIKLLISGDPEELKSLEGEIDTFRLRSEINWVYSQDRYLEILPANVSKGSMLKKLKEGYGSGYTVYAVGDYNNDIEMLEAADVGIATANALPSVKKAADAMTVSNDENAIAHIIHKMIGQEKDNPSPSLE